MGWACCGWGEGWGEGDGCERFPVVAAEGGRAGFLAVEGELVHDFCILRCSISMSL